MRYAPAILVVLVAACATPPPVDPAARNARLVAQYGPQCSQAFKEWSSEWQNCVEGFARREDQESRMRRAQAAAAILGAMPAYQPLPAPYTPPQITCQTVNYGGVVQTRCQ